MSNELTSHVLGGDRTAIAKAITERERATQSDVLPELLHELWPHAGNALTLGFTGPPGVGKSTLIDALAATALEDSKKVAVVGVDPSSELSGGALLADRLRMERASKCAEFTMRSLSSSGERGGLTYAAPLASLVYDAAGYDVVMIESVGVGQTETDIAHIAQLTILVQQQETGDWAQAAKGGIMQIPDVICVNKVPLREQSRVVSAKARTISRSQLRKPPHIVAVDAHSGDGIGKFWQFIQDYYDALTIEKRREHRDKAFSWWAGEMAVVEATKRARAHVASTQVPSDINPLEQLQLYSDSLGVNAGFKSEITRS